jgi:hypothetical protein
LKNIFYRLIATILVFNSTILANEYYAIAQPFEIYNVKAQVSGKVVYVNENVKGKFVTEDTIIKLDSNIDQIDLKQTKQKIYTFKKIIQIEKNILEKYKKIKSKSQIEKDMQNIKVLNLQNQMADLVLKKAILEDKISKKIFIEDKRYISNINIKLGDFIGIGTLLYTTNDLSKAKLEIFLPILKAKQYLEKTIYLDGIKTNYKIAKLYKVVNSQHISSYKCKIIINKPENFSKLVKIEFK